METTCPACLDPIPASAADCPHCGITFRTTADGVWSPAPADQFAEFLDSSAFDEVAAEPPAREPIASPLPHLPNPADVGLHGLFDEVLAQYTAIWPNVALAIGVHPHPRTLPPVADDADDRTLALARALLDRVDEWERGGGTPHDRLDAKALRAWAESFTVDAGDEDAAWLASVATVGYDLLVLSDVPCCDAADRADAALARLAQIAEECRYTVESLVAPHRAKLLIVIRGWEAAADEIREYADRWHGLDPLRKAAMRTAAGAAAAEIASLAGRLRTEVLPRSGDGARLGASGLARDLRRIHGLPGDIRAIYRAALAEYAEASADVRAAEADESPPPTVAVETPMAVIARLASRSREWVDAAPPDPGLRLSGDANALVAQGFQGVFGTGGILSPSPCGVVWMVPLEVMCVRTGEIDLATVATRDRVIAHETYPGHRLAHLVGRSACPIRHFTDDRFTIEGWAVYAESLVHDVGAVASGAIDRLVRAEERQGRALTAMIAILHACRAAPDDRLLELCGATLPQAPDAADTASRNSDAPAPPSAGRDAILPVLGADTMSALHYFVGPREIRRLRALAERAEGASFDSRKFHRRLLEEGPVPARWIAAAWGLPDTEPGAAP